MKLPQWICLRRPIWHWHHYKLFRTAVRPVSGAPQRIISNELAKRNRQASYTAIKRAHPLQTWPEIPNNSFSSNNTRRRAQSPGNSHNRAAIPGYPWNRVYLGSVHDVPQDAQITLPMTIAPESTNQHGSWRLRDRQYAHNAYRAGRATFHGWEWPYSFLRGLLRATKGFAAKVHRPVMRAGARKHLCAWLWTTWKVTQETTSFTCSTRRRKSNSTEPWSDLLRVWTLKAPGWSGSIPRPTLLLLLRLPRPTLCF